MGLPAWIGDALGGTSSDTQGATYSVAQRDYIDAKTKSPTVSVKFDGKEVRDVLSIDVAYSINSTLNTATIRCVNRPPVEPEGKVIISQGYNDSEGMVFTGYVDSVQQDEFASSYTVTCRDPLKKAMDTFFVQPVKFGIDTNNGMFYYSTYNQESGTWQVYEYTSLSELNAQHPETTDNYSSQGVFAEAVVQWLLTTSGLIEGLEIQVDKTNFWIGDLQPVIFHLQSAYDSIQQIADLIGWYVYCDVGGVARFKKRPRRASGYSVWKYTSTSEPYNIRTISHNRSNVDLRNYVEVQGASGIKVVKRAGSPYLGSTPYRGVVIGNDLIDASGIAEFMAARVLSDLNRLKETIAMEVDGNPFIFPGQSVEVRSSAATGTFLIEDVQSTVSADAGYVTTINASTYPGDSLDEDDGDIQANIQVVQAVSIGDPVILVQFDGSSSYSNRGPITEYDWDFGNATYDKTGPEPQAWMVFDHAAISTGTVNVTLNVYDAAGNFGTTTSGITLAGLMDATPLLYRQLYAALTTKGVGSQDGGNAWNSVAIPAISAAASNYAAGGAYSTKGYALFGGSDGVVYKTVDFAMSASGVVTLDGPVVHVSVAENNSEYCLASTQAGSVYKSVDSGVNWTKLKNFGTEVKQAEYGFTDFNYITVVTAAPNPGSYISTDGGGAWIQLVDFGDKTMNWYAGGSNTPYWAHHDGVVASRPAPDPLSFSGGYAPNVVAMTVSLTDDNGVMVVDSGGQHWNYHTAGSGFVMTADNSLNLTRHMIRDGDIPPLVYYATQSGVGKSLDGNQTMYSLLDFPGESMPTSFGGGGTGWGEMVAYGPLAPIEPPVFGKIIVRPDSNMYGGINGVNDGLFFSFSGYSAAGTQMFTPREEIEQNHYCLLVSEGLCTLDYPASVVTQNLSIGEPASIGPGYFVVFGDRDDTVTPLPPSIDNVAYLRTLYAVDFTGLTSASGVASSGQFFPRLYHVNWLSSMMYDHDWGTGGYTTNFSTSFAAVSKNPVNNLGGGSKSRVFVGSSQGLVDLVSYLESFDIPKGALRRGDVIYSNSTAETLIQDDGWTGSITATESSRANTLLARIIGSWVLSGDNLHTYLVKYDSDGVASWSEGSILPETSPHYFSDLTCATGKFSAGWRTPIITDEGVPIILEGPNKIKELTLDRDRMSGAGESPVIGMFTSAVIPSDLYYATADGFYRVSAYGEYMNSIEQLFVLPSGYIPTPNTQEPPVYAGGIISASVSHDSMYTRDYIVLVIQKSTENACQIAWSTDGGFTWSFSPTFAGNQRMRAWWVDP